MPDSPEKFRVQFDFAAEAYKELSDLQQKLQAPTKAEVVRYAIRTLQWVVAAVDSGKSIFVDDQGSAKEVVFPFIGGPASENIKKAPRRQRAAREDTLVSK